MTRHEFPIAVKRAVLKRSEGRCEAVGERYGLAHGVRCNADLSITGVQYDHWPLGAHAPDSATLENCTATCPSCNQHAANHTDKKVEAKIKRVRRLHGKDPDKRKPRPKIKSRGFTKSLRRTMSGRVVKRNSSTS